MMSSGRAVQTGSLAPTGVPNVPRRRDGRSRSARPLSCGYRGAVDAGGRRRWERALVVLALLLGVAAMHAVVAPSMNDHTAASAAPAEHAGVAMSPDAMVGGSGADAARNEPATPASGEPAVPAAPMPMVHDLMHLCLAVLAAVALGVALIVFTIARGRETNTAAPRRTRSVTVAARPPPRTAVRLAQLCVLRN